MLPWVRIPPLPPLELRGLRKWIWIANCVVGLIQSHNSRAKFFPRINYTRQSQFESISGGFERLRLWNSRTEPRLGERLF